MLKYENKKLLIVPVILAFLVALYVTLTTNGPLSWDIYTHINYSLAYMINGLTTTDPLLNAPIGKTIGYAPLFHILLILTSLITGLNLIQSAQVFQIVFVTVAVISVVYISNKLYGSVAGCVSGILLLASFMFTRLLLPIPETIAVIFFLWGVYFYYISIDKENIWYAAISVLMGLLILAVHFSTFVYYVAIITVLSLIYLILSRKIRVIASYLMLIVPLVVVLILGYMMINTLSPEKALELLNGTFSIINDPMSLFMGQKAMGLERYIKCVSILPLIFGIVGFIYSIKNREHVFIAVWALLAFVISNLHWIGVPVYTYRMLIYFVVPTVLLGGYAFSQLLETFKKDKSKFIHMSIIVILLLSLISLGFSLSDESFQYSSVSTSQSKFHTAPPSAEEMEVIDWFKTQNVSLNESMITNNLFFGMVLSSSDVIPMHYSFDVYTSPSSRKSSSYALSEENISYIVYDKSLVMNNSTDYSNLDVVYVEGDYYPVYYFTKEIDDYNFNQIQVGTKVFENNRFIVCQVQ